MGERRSKHVQAFLAQSRFTRTFVLSFVYFSLCTIVRWYLRAVPDDDARTCTSTGCFAGTGTGTSACGVAFAGTGTCYHNDNESNAGNLDHASFNDNDYKSATGIPGCDDADNWNSYDLTGNELDDSGLQRR